MIAASQQSRGREWKITDLAPGIAPGSAGGSNFTSTEF